MQALINELLWADTEPSDTQRVTELSNTDRNMSVFSNNAVNYLRFLLNLLSSPQLLCCINETFIMGLIDGSRTSARDMETNYVVLTACFSAMHVYHHSVPTGGVYCARGSNVDSTDSSAAALRAERCYKINATFRLEAGHRRGWADLGWSWDVRWVSLWLKETGSKQQQ